MPFWRLHYHLIWATYHREPLLASEAVERQAHGSLFSKARELGVLVHALGGVEDHVHMLVSIPPKLAVAECIRQLKGASAYHVNHQSGASGNFGWQDGYGALTFGDRSMDTLVAYVLNQKQHHSQGKTIAIYEQAEEKE